MRDTIRKTLSAGKPFRIAFVGDSLTSTEWVHPNWREIVEYVLKEDLQTEFLDWKIPSWQIRTVNCGYDGATTRDILHKLQSEILLHQPSLIMLMIGGNDKYTLPRDVSKHHLEQIIATCTADGVRVALATDPRLAHKDFDGKDADLREMIRGMSSKVDVFTDLHELMRDDPLSDYFTFISEGGNELAGIAPGARDELHPNVWGNAAMAKYFLQSVFGISFDPKKYLDDVSRGVMFPGF